MPLRTLVTGASRGIGRSIARHLIDQGHTVALSARSESIQDTAAELEGDADGCNGAIGLPADLGDAEQATALPERAAEALGGLDAMVLNGGQVRTSTLAETAPQDISALINVNVTATLLMARAALPHLRSSENPRIIVLAPPPTTQKRWLGAFVPYAVSKLSLSLAVAGLAEELRRYGIAVHGLWPQTLILTDAIIHAHNVAAENCRKPDIVADAVSALLALPPGSESGRFFLDEGLLRERGVTDFRHYAVDPDKPLASDTFISL